MKKSVLLVSMMAAMAPFGLQALSLTINGQTYPNVSVTSVTSTSAGVAIIADDPLNEIGGGGGGVDPGDPQAPDAFSFTAQTGVAPDTVVTSNTVTINGIDSPPSDISVSNGEYRINGGAWTSAAGSIGNGATVAVRHTSAVSNSTQTTTTLTIGGVSGLFRSTTAAAVGACGPLPANVTLTTDLNWAQPGSLVVLPMRNETISTRFVSTNNPAYEGKVSVGNTAGNANVTRELWISACPGTAYSEVPSGCRRTALMPSVNWHQNSNNRFCELSLNSEYYINIRNVDCDAKKDSGTRCDSTRIIYHNGNP